MADKSLYERLGGAQALGPAVDIFYDKMLSDERVAKFFETTDMEKQKGKQKAFLAMAFGGPTKYTGKDMRTAHAHLVEKLGLNDEHFDITVGHLAATLKELGVSDEDIGEVAKIAESVRADVLNK